MDTRLVHYVLKDGPQKGECRPALVVRDFERPGGEVNLQVFTDSPPTGDSNDMLPPLMWVTSVQPGKKNRPGTYHGPCGRVL